MSSAKLQAELLAAREEREQRVQELCASTQATVVLTTLAIPGADKTPDGTEALFRWSVANLAARPLRLRCLAHGRDALGPYAVLSADQDAVTVKRVCVALEESRRQARLLDLDVYTRDGDQLGRGELGLPPRPCLLCSRPAKACIGARRHSMEEQVRHARQLLATV